MKEKFKLGLKAGSAVIAFLISDSLLTEIYALFLMNLDMDEHLIRIFYQTGSVLITLLMTFPIFILVMRIWGKLPRFHLKGTVALTRLNYLVYAVLAMIPMVFLVCIEIFLIHQGQISQEDIISLTQENMIYTLVFSCVLLPVMEEIMFRGIFLHRLLPLGALYAILLTTCFFVIIHYNNPVNMLLSLVTGLVLTHMAVKAKGILPTIIFHIGINLLGQVILPLCIGLLL
ncbi:MAG: CPBP family intramembrane metalloprotease [Lachnospiraceae bacterium]|nr:CPBP family intramembrane metalloprotease [Lachnospiraceae bacterium]